MKKSLVVRIAAACSACVWCVGCAGPRAQDDWSDVMPKGARTYAIIQSSEIGDADASVSGGVGLKMRNERNALRTEIYFGGNGDDVDSWNGGLLEASAFITPWRVGSRNAEGKGVVFEPYVTGGLRYDAIDMIVDGDSVGLGSVYGVVGATVHFWTGAQGRIYLDSRLGPNVNFGSVDIAGSPDASIDSGIGLHARSELGFDWKRLNVVAFTDYRELSFDNTGGLGSSEVTTFGLQIGYVW